MPPSKRASLTEFFILAIIPFRTAPTFFGDNVLGICVGKFLLF